MRLLVTIDARSLCLAALCLVYAARLSAGELPIAAGDSRKLAADLEQHIQPLLKRHCFQCHSGDAPKGQLNLAVIGAVSLSDASHWKRIWDIVQAREMPPAGEPQPNDSERARLLDWLLDVMSLPGAGNLPNPGRVVVRRLNQVEYNNTLFDLFSFNKPPSYFDPQRGMPEQVRLVPHRDYRPILAELPPDDVGYGFDNIGEILSLPPFLMEKYLMASRHVLTLAMNTAPTKRGDVPYRSMMFNRLRSQAGPEASRETARTFLSDFGRRAFRRPLDDAELNRYLRLFDAARDGGASFEKSVAASVQGLLISPCFLFRIEEGDPQREQQGIRPLTDYELATRLSYFLWSSMPDEELLRLAGSGELHHPAVLEEQARRMLRSRKSRELAHNFGLQWLQVRDIQGAMPDPELFPVFYKRYLPHAMRQEALLLFETIMIEDRSVLEFIDPDFTWLNGTLAAFYGIANPAGEQNSHLFWHRYPITDKRRGGVLTMGATLAATSNSTRTSPVKRGKWMLEAILGSPPPPPLDNVPDLDNTPASEDGVALKEKLRQHRSDAACAGCHQRMDPLGLGLENYDAIGAWRDREGPLAIEAGGTLSDGSRFAGPEELKTLVLEKRRDQYLRCLSQHMLTYALGRRLEPYDLSTVENIANSLAGDEYRFSRLVVEIVKSYPFRYLKTVEAPHE